MLNIQMRMYLNDVKEENDPEDVTAFKEDIPDSLEGAVNDLHGFIGRHI